MPSIQDLLTHGIALVPIPYGKKSPANLCWNASHNVLKNPNQAHLATNMNIGITHAYCSPTPTCAIDLDDCKEARKWFASNNIDLMALLCRSDAVVIHSGKNNSLKLLYRLPAGVPPMSSKQIKSPSKSMIVEFRCAAANGLTVQDVLPPSKHPSGTLYKYIGNGSILNLPTIPDDMFKLWLSLLLPTPKKAQKVINKQDETERNKSIVQAKLACVSADCDYFTYRDVVWSILSTGWSSAEEIAKNWCQTAPDRFDAVDFINLVNSYSPNVPNPITLGTLDFLAKKGGWNG